MYLTGDSELAIVEEKMWSIIQQIFKYIFMDNNGLTLITLSKKGFSNNITRVYDN